MTVALRVEHPESIRSYKYNFGLNGYDSDYFFIGQQSGAITVASSLSARLYTLGVTAFIRGTLANGTEFTNFTEADVSIYIHG